MTQRCAVSGKALGSYPGMAIVFHDGTVHEGHKLPRYLDLALYDAEKKRLVAIAPKYETLRPDIQF